MAFGPHLRHQAMAKERCELTSSQFADKLARLPLQRSFDLVHQTDCGNPSLADGTVHDATDPKEKEQAVAKANEAIAIRPKRGKLTLLSRRIYNVFLFHAQRQGVDKPTYCLPLAELIKDARFNSNNTEILKSHIRDMQATTIEWHTSVGGTRRWTSTQLLGTVSIDDPGRGRPCHISWTYPDPIREHLIRPAHYTRILLEISSQMRSYAASVLYELGARYLSSPTRLTMREDVLWWASVLTGRSDIVKVDYRILHRDTIKKALAELDTLSEDFRMEVVEHKRGRKVEELQFKILPKGEQPADSRSSPVPLACVLDLALIEQLVSLGFKPRDAQDFYAATDETLLRAALDHVTERMQNAALPPLKSPAAYLRTAVKKKYPGLPARERTSEGTASAVSAPAVPETRLAIHPGPELSMEERLRQLREDWNQHQATMARTRFLAMGVSEQDAYVSRFEIERLPHVVIPVAKAWRKDGIDSRIAGSTFNRWLASVLWPGDATDAELLRFAVSLKRG